MQACAARGTASRMMSTAECRRSLLLTMLTWAGLAGNYSDEAGATFCHACPTFAYTQAAGSDNATDCVCNAGYTGPAGGGCTACPEGQYKDALGNAECTNCPAGAQRSWRAGRQSETDRWWACVDDAYLGWQATTQTRQGLPSAMPVLPQRTRTRLEATTLPTVCATPGTRALVDTTLGMSLRQTARHALMASTRTHSGAPSVQTARQVRRREEQHALDDTGHRP